MPNDLAPSNLYTILCDLEAADVDIQSLRDKLKTREIHRAHLKSEAARIFRGQPRHAVAHGPGDSHWQLVDDDVVRVPTVNGLMMGVARTLVVGSPAVGLDEVRSNVEVRLAAPFKHRESCLCPACIDIRSNCSPVIDRPKANSVV